ncbi:MAG: flagella basal body P-ring formation protein FlgA [Clostridia bacterium]|nr:flagella basal body P-ring formation protein FlgA [Clostridia bacterium]
MIGMSQIKKKTIQGIVIGASVGIAVAVGIGVWSFFTIRSYQNGTNKNYIKNYTTPVAVLKRNIVQGEIITSDMIETVNVNNATVPTGVVDASSVVGLTAKYNIAAKVPITGDMVSDEIVAADVRDVEINTVLMPSDLVEGDTVDIRIMYPNGTDYIVLAQKTIDKIYDTTFWCKLSEDEIQLLNCATVDSFLYSGSKLYALKYTDSDAQVKTSADIESETKGYIETLIADNWDTISQLDEKEAAAQLYSFIYKYKNFANAATKTTQNYQPNTQVMSAMKSNQYLLKNATTELARLNSEARSTIESGIKNYQSQNSENYENVVTGAQQSIITQQTERENLLEGK